MHEVNYLKLEKMRWGLGTEKKGQRERGREKKVKKDKEGGREGDQIYLSFIPRFQWYTSLLM